MEKTTTGPLAGLRVIDLGLSWAGPFCSALLSDLGADVIKVESSQRIDILRWSGAFHEGIRDYESSGWFHATNRGKRSVALNLKTARGRELFLSLVTEADVLVENFAPRVMASLDLGVDVLLEANPDLVMMSMSGYGATGPEKNFIGYGDHLMHASGFASVTGHPDDPDTKMSTFYGDPVGGLLGAIRVLASLFGRDLGRQHDLSQVESLIAMMPADVVRASVGASRPRSADKHPDMAPHGFYRSRGTDSWVTVAVRSDEEWQVLRELMLADGVEVPALVTLADRKADEAGLDAAMQAWTRRLTAWQVTDLLQGKAIAAFPAYSSDHLLKDPNLAARGFHTWVTRPFSGTSVLPGPLFTMSDDGCQVRGPAPLLGQHSVEVLAEIEVDAAQVASLVDQGVVS